MKLKTVIFIFLGLANFVASGQEFIPNKGQWVEPFQYKWSSGGHTVFFENNGLTFVMTDAEQRNKAHQNHGHQDQEISTLNKHAFKITFEDGNLSQYRPTEPLKAYHNYFLGKKQDHWQSRVPLYQELNVNQVYPGIAIEYLTQDYTLKYNIVVSPGANYKKVKMKYQGVDTLYLKNNFLVVETSVGSMVEQEPVVWQMVGGEKKFIPAKFVLNNQTLSFEIESYQKDLPLIIDPQYIFSTYSGSAADNFGFTACYDFSGRLYGAGVVYGTGYPVSLGAYQEVFGGGQVDIGISKFSSDGTQLLYATYVGGNKPDQPHSMIVGGPDQGLYVMGITGSGNFPVTTNAYDTTFGGGTYRNIGGRVFDTGTDLVVFHLDSTGSNMIGSTYMGGSANDGVNDSLRYNYGDESRGEIIFDSTHVYIASASHSQDFPNQASSTPANLNAVVFGLDLTCQNLSHSNVLGGSRPDAAFGIKVIREGLKHQLIVAGGTRSSDLQTSTNAYQSSYAGGWSDGFILAYNLNTAAIDYLTYNGTSDYDQNYFVALDHQNFIYTYGQTKGAMPVTSGVYSNPNSAQFIQKFNKDLSQMLKGTVFGSGNISNVNISPTAFMIDLCKNIYLSGWGGVVNYEGSVLNMPTTANAEDKTTDGNDFYFLVLDGSWKKLEYASYFGGASSEHVDGGTSRFSPDGTIYQAICAGCTQKSFPTFPNNVYSHINGATSGGRCNLGCTKIHFDYNQTKLDITLDPDSACTPYQLTWTDNSRSVDRLIWDFGDNTYATGFNPNKVYLDSGHYIIKVIGIDTLCNTTDTTYLDLWLAQEEPLADFSIEPYDTCNRPYTVQFKNNSIDANKYLWQFGDNQISNLENPTHTYNQQGSYQVKLKVFSNRCNAMDSTVKNIFFKTSGEDANFIVDFNACDTNRLVTLSQTGLNYSSFEWLMGDGSDTLKGENVTHQYRSPGTYTITLISKDNRCNVTDVVTQTVTFLDYLDEEELLPNIFTPDDDGVNDYFKLVHADVANYLNNFHLEVYDRWGIKVYSTSNPNFIWDGRFKGKYLSSGVYFWLVKFNNTCSSGQQLKGIVHITK